MTIPVDVHLWHGVVLATPVEDSMREMVAWTERYDLILDKCTVGQREFFRSLGLAFLTAYLTPCPSEVDLIDFMWELLGAAKDVQGGPLLLNFTRDRCAEYCLIWHGYTLKYKLLSRALIEQMAAGCALQSELEKSRRQVEHLKVELSKAGTIDILEAFGA